MCSERTYGKVHTERHIARTTLAALAASLVIGLLGIGLAARTAVGSAAMPLHAPPGNSPGTVSIEPSLDATAAHRATEALSMISYPWETKLPGWSLHFLPGRPGYQGMTFPGQRLIEVYVRPPMSELDIAAVTAHELGHAVDASLLSPADRDAWRDARHLPSAAPWNPTSAAPDFDSAAGDFAEAFAAWQVGKRSLSELADQPDDAQFALLARLSRVDGPTATPETSSTRIQLKQTQPTQTQLAQTGSAQTGSAPTGSARTEQQVPSNVG